MLLSQIFDDLGDGELSKLNLGGNLTGGIDEIHYPKIIRYLNRGLIEIYKQFLLKEKEVVIKTDATITDYILTYDYAASNTGGAEPIKYIQDSALNPFPDDVLQIERVVDVDGDKVPLNDFNDDESFFTDNEKTLQIPVPVTDELYSIIYRPYPAAVDDQTTDPTAVDVEVPQQLAPALYAHIAYSAHLGLPEGENSKATAMFGRFLGIVNDVKRLGTINKEQSTTEKLDDRGYV